jgi:acetylxylan esterase
MLHHHRSTSGAHAQRRLSRRFFATAAAGAMLASGLAVGGMAISATPAVAVSAPSSGCAAVNLIVTRASTEAQGEGITGNLASAIVSASTQTVSVEATTYPASLTNYASSESQGVTAIESELSKAESACPNQKQVLLGYSQGAQASLDTITGNGEVSGGTAGKATSAELSKVVAIAVFGDPGHVTKQPWDLGTSTTNGIFPRNSSEDSAIASFAGGTKIAAWCDANDEFCSSGNSLQVHLTYLNRYQTAAEDFVLNLIGG